MAIRGILFDNDGTLVDTHDLILSSMRHATRQVLERDLPDEVLMAQVGIPLATQMLDFADGDERLCDELLRVYRAHNHAHHDSQVKLFPDVLDGLRDLHAAGLRMGVVTAKLHALAQRGLQITGAWQYLDCLVAPDDCPKAKPDPDPIIMAADLLGLACDECIYLGDSPFDMQAGLAAGCTTVAALWGMFSSDALQSCNPHFACQTFSDFVARVCPESTLPEGNAPA
ncbi:MAG TPA: HAD family hydrolase [Eggerthellaceae bacterium]|nr:HAD family hydrolase [Eggerthellaceae bacterium]